MFTQEEQSRRYIYSKGEMADKIRSFNWTATSLGEIPSWPLPLLTTVNLILDSRFPMFIWWGKEKIQFYNDVYLQILGTDENSKHPKALGQCGEDCWQEIWPVIHPLLEKVEQTGEPVYLEDQLIPIYRQGRLDDVYWTFGYNVIRNETGEPGGILVICSETTEKVRNQQEIVAINEELAASNEELTATNEDLSRSQQELKVLNEELEQRVARRTQEVLHAELATKQQAQRLASVIQHVPSGLAILSGRDMVLEMANSYMLNLWDKDSSIIGMALLDYMPELREQAFPGILDDVYTTGIPFFAKDAAVELILGGDRQVVYMDFSYTPLKNNAGQTESILVLAEDVTERTLNRQREQQLSEELSAINEELAASNEELTVTNEELAEAQQSIIKTVAQLEESEGRFQNLVRDATVGIIVLVGDELRTVIVNDAYAKLIGRTAQELIHQPLFEIIPEAEADFRPIIDQVRLSGEPIYLFDTPYAVGTDNKKIEGFLNLTYQPFKAADGKVIGTMVLCQDVTEQVNAKKVLEESEERFRFMLNAIPQQVWTATPEGALDYVNENVISDFGQSGEEVVGQGWQNFIHPEDLPQALTAWQQSLRTGHEYQVEFRLKFKDEEYHWHLARALPLIEGNTIILWLGTNTNIELQKRNEQKKDEFLSIASHELKTPLTSIKAFNQLMQRSTDPSKLKGFVAKSADHITRLEKLISDLLDVTKINAGKLNYNMQPFEFKQMLQESIEAVQHTAPDHNIILESNADVVYHGDRLRLEQVVNNFLTNAVKYSPSGKRVLVNSWTEADSIIVSVQDYGIGIAEDSLDKIFDRYYRVDNTAMRFEGLGLGLFISSEILKRHKGSFWIESKLGEGSTFYFRLPVTTAPATEHVIDTGDFYQDKHIRIQYNKERNRLDADWNGFQDLASVQHSCLQMLSLLERHQCSKVLNDNTKVLGTWSEASDWGGKEWFPMMERAGLRSFAWIFSPSAFSQLSARKSVDIMEGNIVIQFFTDADLAERWIDNQ